MLNVPRVPLLGDPLRRIELPSDFDAVTTIGAEEDPSTVGLSEHQIERIWKAALGLYRSRVHPALQLCLRRNGRVVLNRAIGHAKGNGPQDKPDADKVLATPDTPFCVFSTSKAVTAVVIHLLHERGVLDINDRVAKYIPDYASHGKEHTTIAHVMAHRAGVPGMPREALDLDRVGDREFLTRAISDAKPIVRPGTLLAYHALSGGFILGEIVQRTTDRSVAEVLREEILEPLSFRWGNFGVAPEDIDRVALNYATGPPLLPPFSTLVTRVLSQPIDKVVELSNDPRFLTAVIPSGNLITSANELSRFFEIFRMGGELNGVRIVRTETVRRAVAEQSRLEIDLSLGFPTRFSYGFMLGAKVLSLYGRDTDFAFGHLGLINIMGWADPERGLSGGLLNNGKAIVYPELPRFYGLMQRIASEVPKVPESERIL